MTLSCSKGSDPVTPDGSGLDQNQSELTGNFTVQSLEGSNRYLAGYFNVTVDTVSGIAEIVPDRSVMMHYNAVFTMHEIGRDDFVDIYYPGMYHGEPAAEAHTISFSISNIFPDNFNTYFDVRGIVMFEGHKYFESHNLMAALDPETDNIVTNPDGYTTLYNPYTEGNGPAYWPGVWGYLPIWPATEDYPNVTLCPFIRFKTDVHPLPEFSHIDNYRNAFFPGCTESEDFEMQVPTDPVLKFGFAVDCCRDLYPYSEPEMFDDPVGNYLDRFPPGANCEEPWKIEVSDTFETDRAEVTLTIDVYDDITDPGFSQSHFPPKIECPELIPGIVLGGEGHADAIEFKFDDGAFCRYEVRFVPTVQYSIDKWYPVLISVEDEKNDGEPLLDLTAYKTHYVQFPRELLYFTVVDCVDSDSYDDITASLQTAWDSGYTKVVLSDYFFHDPVYVQDHSDFIDDFVATASTIGMQVIPSIQGWGYNTNNVEGIGPVGGNHEQWYINDNENEGQPVWECEFLVEETAPGSDVLVINQIPDNLVVANHDLDPAVVPIGWTISPANVRLINTDGHGDSDCVEFYNPVPGPEDQFVSGALEQSVMLEPANWQCYEVSVFYKTLNISPTSKGTIRITAKGNVGGGDDVILNYWEQTCAPTFGEWGQEQITYYFNSQDFEQVYLRFDVTLNNFELRLDDIHVENIGLAQIINHDYAPVSLYREVQPGLLDYFDYWTEYVIDYDTQTLEIINPFSFTLGETIKADFFHKFYVDGRGFFPQSEARTHLRVIGIMNYFDDLDDLYSNIPSILLGCDEIRGAGWRLMDFDHLTNMASPPPPANETMSRLIRQADVWAHFMRWDTTPWKLIPWSDMLDPVQNGSTDPYYLFNGLGGTSCTGSLFNDDWIIGNWNPMVYELDGTVYNFRGPSMAHFDSYSKPQILCGYYGKDTIDGDWDPPIPAGAYEIDPYEKRIEEWLDQSVPYESVYAVMYCVWDPPNPPYDPYEDLDEYAQRVRYWELYN